MNLKQSYSTLGIEPGVDLKQVTKAYRKLAMKYHPDVNKAEDANEKFALINEAYESIKNKDEDFKNLLSSEFHTLNEDFTFENQDALRDIKVITEEDEDFEITDVEKFIYLSPEEAQAGKELEVKYMVERYNSPTDDPSYEYETINITIPAGVKQDQVITIKGIGNQTPDGKKSNLNIIIEIDEEE